MNRLALFLTLACGLVAAPTARGDDEHPAAPRVSGFSPVADPKGGITYTDGRLTTNAVPGCEGRVAVLLREGTEIDVVSAISGDSSRTAAIRLTRFVPGVGDVLVDVRSIGVGGNRITLTPRTLPLPEGRYTVSLFDTLRGPGDVRLLDAPVFHAFVVGSADAVTPVVTTTGPVDAVGALRESVDALQREIRALRNEVRELRALVERLGSDHR